MKNFLPPAVRPSAKRALFASALLLSAAFHGAPALAQSSDMNGMLNRLSRLENEIQTLSQQVYRGSPPPAASGGGAGGTLAPGVAADLEVRLTRLEDELRRLTGRYEEAMYGVQQLRERLEKINSDVDYRLLQLESKPGSGGAAPVTGAAAAAPTPAKPAADQGQKASAGGNTLGTLPQNGGQGSKEPQAAMAGPGPNANEQEQYDYAFGLLRQADYVKAEQALSTFVAKHPNSSLAGNAQYWLGETFYARQKYKEAAIAFAEGYQKYPKSSKASDNLLKLGMALGQLNQKQDACVALGQLKTQFPDAPASIKKRADQETSKLGCR